MLADIVKQLSKEERKDFLAALDDKSISAPAIAKVMRRRGFKLTPDVISRYRRGDLSTDLREVSDEV